jgi:hypothetical protein
MRKKTILVVLSVVAASLAGCKHFCPGPGQTEQFGNPCLAKNVVCVDPKSLHVSQDPVHIHGGDIAHFFITDGDGNLTISYAPGLGIDSVHQEGSHVWVKTMPVKEAVHRKYTVEIKGRRSPDPEMVIEP